MALVGFPRIRSIEPSHHIIAYAVVVVVGCHLLCIDPPPLGADVVIGTNKICQLIVCNAREWERAFACSAVATCPPTQLINTDCAVVCFLIIVREWGEGGGGNINRN